MRLFTLITFFAFSALFSLGLNAFEIKDSFSEKLRPSMSIERDDSGITVEISINGAIQEEDDLFPGSFSLNIPGFGLNMTPGEPAFPLRVDRYEIPFGMTAEVQVLESHYSVIAKKISPARPDLINSSGDSYSLSNIAKIKPYDNWFPEHPISEGGIKIYRDRQLLSICFYPIAYNWESEEIKVFDTIKYKIEFIENTACYAQRNLNYVIHEVDSVYMRNVFTSYDQDSSNNQCDNISNYKLGGTPLEPVLPPDVAFNWKKGEGYLILSRSCYESAVNKFSKWKRSLGYDTHIVMNGTWTPNSIRNAIKNQYDSDPNLKYVLFVGDELDIPGELKTSIYSSDGNPIVVPYYTDYFYCCMDGSQDDTPDLISGRLSVTTLNEANIVVDKIINYEKYNNSESRNRVAHCSEFSDLYREANNLVGSDGIEDRNFTRTSEYISVGAESLGKSVKRIYNYNGAQNITPQKWSKYAGGGALPDYLTSDSFNWNGDSGDIISSINDGVQYVFHRDHGDIQGWVNPKFTNAHINSLSNGKKTPVIFSINCLTGMYQYNTGAQRPDDLNSQGRSTCFAEKMLRHKNGGAAAVIAASQISFTFCNDAMSLIMMQNIWPNAKFIHSTHYFDPTNISKPLKPIRKIGELLNATKQQLVGTYNGEMLEHNIQIFHCFGDPSMSIVDESPIIPSYKVQKTNIDPTSSSNNDIYNIEFSQEVKLIQVPIDPNSHVYCSDGKNHKLTYHDLCNYDIYVAGDGIMPAQLSIVPDSELEKPSMKIESIVVSDTSIDIKYFITSNYEKPRIEIKNITNGKSHSEYCDINSRVMTIATQKIAPGMCVIELIDGNTVYDSKKIILM